jgi:GTPase SAR1 family protein
MSVIDKKYALFIVGERNSGKSTLIRSLTGCGRNKVYNIRTLSGQPLKAFVSLSSPQEMGMSNHPPQNFPQSIEDKYGVGRNDYDILISALELVVGNPVLYGYQQYIKSVQNQGFDVRLAVIQTSWNNIPANLNEVATIQSYAQQRNIPIALVNASNDPNEESSRIRRNLYP